MTEQEIFKTLLKSLIDETENDNITSADEIINLIVHELQKTLSISSSSPAIN